MNAMLSFAVWAGMVFGGAGDAPVHEPAEEAPAVAPADAPSAPWLKEEANPPAPERA